MRFLKNTLLNPIVSRMRSRRDLKALRNWHDIDQRRADFYSKFFGNGDLVFDVGANVGNRTKIFSRLGARVISFEPQPYCLYILRKAFAGNALVKIVGKGLGEQEGQTVLNLSEAHTISSMSETFMHATTKTGRFGNLGWKKKIIVDVMTLDQAVKCFGVPRFVKIDVEGYELSVLRGLSKPVQNLSFEFTPECIDTAVGCINRLSDLGAYQFRLSLGEELKWESPDWMSPAAMTEALRRCPSDHFGDIYAKLAP